MKKFLMIVVCCLALVACQRKATVSSWSPINDISTPGPAGTATAAALSAQTLATNPPSGQIDSAPLPTPDWTQFPNPLPDSLKGYELVSWKVGETWNFTLVTGTNRDKSFEELMKPDSEVTSDGYVKITVSGIDQIKKVLAMLPVNSEVIWGGMDLSGQVPEGTVYFSYPPVAAMNQLADFCAQNSIKLMDLSQPE